MPVPPGVSSTSSWPVPNARPSVWTNPPSPARFASLLRTRPEGCAIALLGLPDDTGVRLNNGRIGAREGPAAFRAALLRYGVNAPYEFDWPAVFDAGDVVTPEVEPGREAEALHEMHRRVSEASAWLASQGMVVFGVGGGHDLTYALVRGAAQGRRSAHAKAGAAAAVKGLAFDAHLDVRETVGSGMGFRKLLEERIASSIRIVGYDPLANSREHTEWFLRNGGSIGGIIGAGISNAAGVGTGSALGTGSGPPPGLPQGSIIGGIDREDCFVSVDLDCIAMEAAPGVSAPNPIGLSAHEVSDALSRLGQIYSPFCVDLMELCPAHDEGGRTARLAAHLFLSFLRGRAMRSPRPL